MVSLSTNQSIGGQPQSSFLTGLLCYVYPITFTPETGGHVCQFHHPTVFQLIFQSYEKIQTLINFTNKFVNFYTFNNFDSLSLDDYHKLPFGMSKNYEIDNIDLKILFERGTPRGERDPVEQP